MAPRTTTWRAIVNYAQPGDELTDERVEALIGALPGFGVAIADGTQLQLQLSIEAGTLRQAVDAALPAARAAHSAAYGNPGEPTSMRVLPAEEYDREIAYPSELDLVGATEIGEMLGVSRQRAAELAGSHPDFPNPIGRTGRGPVFTRESIEAFEGTWDRSARGGRPRKADGGSQ